MTPFQELDIKVKDAVMFFTLCLAVGYVFSLSVVCGYYYNNIEAFTGLPTGTSLNCYANSDSNVPTSYGDHSAKDITEEFKATVKLGLIVHILGVFGDSSFAARVYVKKTQWFRLGSLILVSLYTILWLGWLIWLHIVVFNHEGKVCSGSYLPDSEQIVQQGYAI